MNVAVIPARGGSKRIPRKNISEFYGKPMVAWSIAAAIKSDCFERIIVSTDDDEIANIARQYGAEVPFIRPAELSDDFTGTASVVRHTIEWFLSQGIKPKYVCCIYATAPFLIASDLQQGLALIEQSQCDYAFSVTGFAFPIQRALKVLSNGRVKMFFPDYMNARSQDLEEGYHDAGQFYWGRTDAWAGDKPIFESNSVPFLMPRHRVQDIDTPEDWLYAELMYHALMSMHETEQA